MGEQTTLLPGSYAPLIEEFVAVRALSMSHPYPNAIIAEAVRTFPGAPALEAAFAFVCVASALERPVMLPKEVEENFVAELHRAIAVFVADIYAVVRLYGPSPTCSNVCDFWAESKERFFTGLDLSLLTEG